MSDSLRYLGAGVHRTQSGRYELRQRRSRNEDGDHERAPFWELFALDGSDWKLIADDIVGVKEAKVAIDAHRWHGITRATSPQERA